MAHYQNRLSKFWQELKRRRVLHVITVYATASFAIIEVIGNLTEPLNLPTSLSTIVIIVLAVGFPPAIILSWLYDLTSGTFERTKPLDETEEEVKPVAVPNAWKIATYVSFVVIVGLVVFNVITRGNVIKPGSIQSVVILPFRNFTGVDTLDPYIEGMHYLLINEIGKIKGLRVISEVSSNSFKNSDKTIPQIAKELKVDAAIELGVLCFGDMVCMQPRLISSDTEEKQLWEGDYSEPKGNLLNMYKQIIKQIADEIKISLTSNEEAKLAESRTIDREVIDAFLKARSYIYDGSRESLFKALEFLNSGVVKNPDWASLYAGLAEVWLWIQQNGFEPPSVTAPKILENLNKALDLDPDLAEAHYLSATIAQWVEWDWAKAEREFLKALAVNPNDAQSRILYSQILLILRRYDEALEQRELAMSLDPLNPNMRLLYIGTLLQAGDFKNGLSLLEEALDADPANMTLNYLIEFSACRLKEFDKAIRSMKYSLPFSIEEDIYKGIVRIYKESGIVQAYEELMKHLEKYAEKNPISFMDMSFRYIAANQLDKAIDWIEKGYEIHDPQMMYITESGRYFEQLFGNPRFLAIVKKMNLPLPKSD